jgi:hypothetical protein
VIAANAVHAMPKREYSVMRKAKGHRGSWFAEVDGELLPCVHQHWSHRGRYHDPHVVPGDPKWTEFIAAIRTDKKVILMSGEFSNNDYSVRRTGYIAVFMIDDFELLDNDLRFRFAKRLVDLE